ncbi:MAG: methylenetetrahydrofolate reductase C-terminal domain-containing protein, partial [Spirochaetota bacterium]
MVVNVPKPDNEILDSLAEYKSVFIVACGGCPGGCESGGSERIQELASFLSKSGKKVTGDALIDFLCNKALVGSKLYYYLEGLKRADAVLVVSCGIGVQATGNILDIPSIPANDTLSSQGMQGLWPSSERCSGCGTCYLALTGGICPITTCSKSLLNGMCGGQHDDKCEVEENRDCGWALIYNRLKELGKLDNLRKISDLRDYRKQDVPDHERTTTRWALEKTEIYTATKPATAEEEA